MTNPIFREVSKTDLERCYTIESEAYEGDEAATREKIAIRIQQYPEGFVCAELNGQVIGFINSGCAWEVVMSDEEFKELIGHDGAAPNVVIMSVVLDPAYQCKGYASLMMREFVNMMKEKGKKSIHLMCKTHHIELYKKFGYSYIKPSGSEHGGMAWHEMIMTL
ncbi:GNAT family N-acetyltransferase [Providencia burhodogranariea]|uniref:Acetyltransferase n=1 Tax=Providencia burhodogranariea DSM 19968 TaxID=1141662 RepID=K8WSL8_9GAMM|nr:GNAT family N-acetyltransferase [Providencia burhodogranariea]EKT62926.1 acetyltransferase [Providencia burhodogranariea DSM 19968]